MSLWTKAALGVAVATVCAGSAAAQLPAPPAGCAACASKGGVLAGPVPNTIPHCSKHSGLTQYPLSEKRYIKQFCNPTICPNSCFGHFKTQWTAWPSACPGWPAEGVDPANYGPNFARYEPAQPPTTGVAVPATAAPSASGQKATDVPATPLVPPSKPLDLPPSKPVTPAAPKVSPLDVPPVPMPTAPPGGIDLPKLPPAGSPGKF